MSDDIVGLTSSLIKFRSIPEYPDQLEKCLEFCLRHIKAETVEHFSSNGSRSILAYNAPARPDRFRVILNGHLDVIPGKTHQYEPNIVGDRLYGAGATDMKANVACIITVFNKLASKVRYPLALQLVTDEELGGFNGTKYQISQGVRTDFVIAAESTDFNIVNEARGVIWAKLTARGQTAHGAYPWRGDNAVLKMMKFIAALESEFPSHAMEGGNTNINISGIDSANQTYNKIPDQCEVRLDIRHLPGESEEVLEKLGRIIPEDLTLEIVAQEPALFVPDDNSFLMRLKKSTEEIIRRKCRYYCAQGSSDARHFSSIGDAGVEFGPIGGGIGTDEEWIDINSLPVYCSILERFLLAS